MKKISVTLIRTATSKPFDNENKSKKSQINEVNIKKIEEKLAMKPDR